MDCKQRFNNAYFDFGGVIILKTVFELCGVGFAYPYDEPVLKNITLSVCEGERISVLGVNGCGKSTLLKILAGALCHQQGAFKAFGKEVSEREMSDDKWNREYHTKVGYIFQDSDVQLFCSSVEEEIAFGLLQTGVSQHQASERVNDVLNLLNIEHLKNKTPFKLSGGEKKKVAIASVLSMNPQVLILDEPTNGLDPRTQRWLAELLLALNRAGKTLISSTHNLELVQELSERAVLIGESHTIEADMPTQELLSDIPLLIRTNLVDEYYHKHDGAHHSHFHIHNHTLI